MPKTVAIELKQVILEIQDITRRLLDDPAECSAVFMKIAANNKGWRLLNQANLYTLGGILETEISLNEMNYILSIEPIQVTDAIRHLSICIAYLGQRTSPVGILSITVDPTHPLIDVLATQTDKASIPIDGRYHMLHSVLTQFQPYL